MFATIRPSSSANTTKAAGCEDSLIYECSNVNKDISMFFCVDSVVEGLPLNLQANALKNEKIFYYVMLPPQFLYLPSVEWVWI